MLEHKKVLIIHNLFWSHYKAIVFSELNNICLKNNVDIQVLHIAHSSTDRMVTGNPNADLHQYCYDIAFDTPLDELDFYTETWYLLKYYFKYNPTCLILPGYDRKSFWVLLIIARITFKPVIVGVDSTEKDHHRHWLKEIPKKIFISLCSVFFSYGTPSIEYLIKLGANPKKIFKRVNSTNNKKYNEVYNQIINGIIEKPTYKNPRNFLFVGRLIEIKNVERLLIAFKNATNDNEKWGLVIVGDGTNKDMLIEVAQKLNISDRVTFTGGLNWEKIIPYYATCDVFVLPSISEPWGLVVNEAMVCNMPVLVSNYCGCSLDLVHEGVNGHTFDPYNTEELAEKMQLFILNESKLKDMGEKSAQIISHYSPENSAKQMYYGIEKTLNL